MNVRHRAATAALFCLAAGACTHEQSAPAAEQSGAAAQTEATAPATQAEVQPVQAEPAAAPATASIPSQTVTNEPLLGEMRSAIQTGKLSAPVDILYKFSDDVTPGRPVSVDFAVSPTVAGSNLRVELAANDAAIVESNDAKLTVQKADANGVYRKRVTLTPRAGLTKLQVIVYLNVGADVYAGVYSIPVGPSADAKAVKSDIKRKQQ